VVLLRVFLPPFPFPTLCKTLYTLFILQHTPPPVCQAVGTNFLFDFDIFLLFLLDLLFFIAAVLHKHKKRRAFPAFFTHRLKMQLQ